MPKYVLVIIYIILVVDGFRINKVKRKTAVYSDLQGNDVQNVSVNRNFTENEGRGFFPPGGLFAIGKVLNFFPVGGGECKPSTISSARAGLCLNPYDCRQRDGRAAGDCAHGLGVCCLFEVTCGGVVRNNITYFMSPGFPELWTEEKECTISIEKLHAGITQLKIDFVNFNIGQPNRTTGECDEDILVLGGSDKVFHLCGQNHGQHLYYDMSTKSEALDDDDFVSVGRTTLTIKAKGAAMSRLWLLKLAQMPLAYSAPHDCLQYYTQNEGIISTFNYASNGRHLSDQSYRTCVRRNIGYCGIKYSPCSERSFRIGPGANRATVMPEDPIVDEGMMIVNETESAVVQDEELGSGDEPAIDPRPEQVATQASPQKSYLSMIWSYIWPDWLWGSQNAAGRSWKRWSPYAQHYSKKEDFDDYRYHGYGNFGVGLVGYGRQRCTDRLTIPCDNEYFVSSSAYGPGVCDPHHCGGSFCPGLRAQDCHVETSVAPFSVSINFGPPTFKTSAEDNIGACLRYTQLPCEG